MRHSWCKCHYFIVFFLNCSPSDCLERVNLTWRMMFDDDGEYFNSQTAKLCEICLCGLFVILLFVKAAVFLLVTSLHPHHHHHQWLSWDNWRVSWDKYDWNEDPNEVQWSVHSQICPVKHVSLLWLWSQFTYTIVIWCLMTVGWLTDCQGNNGKMIALYYMQEI